MVIITALTLFMAQSSVSVVDVLVLLFESINQ